MSGRQISANVKEKEFVAKLGEAQSSATSGTINLKSSNPKGSLLRAGGRGGWGIPPALQILGEISSNFFESTPPISHVKKLRIYRFARSGKIFINYLPALISLMTLVQKAIIKKDNKFLTLLRSADAKFFPEHWDFPGGKLEFNEEPFSGVEREVLEETNLKVKAIKVVGVYELEGACKGEKFPHRFTIYSTDILSGDVRLSHEHLAFKWATKEEILQLKIQPYMKSYFEEHP